jgi:hypothetical protein
MSDVSLRIVHFLVINLSFSTGIGNLIVIYHHHIHSTEVGGQEMMLDSVDHRGMIWSSEDDLWMIHYSEDLWMNDVNLVDPLGQVLTWKDECLMKDDHFRQNGNVKITCFTWAEVEDFQGQEITWRVKTSHLLQCLAWVGVYGFHLNHTEV